MIQVKNINLSFGTQKVFDNISFTLQRNQRIGLVGANGSGKSTLLKAIVNQQILDGGEIALTDRASIAYMPQEVVLQSTKTVYEEAFSTFEKLYALQQQEVDLQKKIEAKSTQELIDQFAQVHHELDQLEPHSATRQTHTVLTGLGFSEHQQNQSVSELSVGWKMRLVLAKLLLKDADFYLFDEPTNHLDIVAKEWFLDFLKNASFGFILVCHDRYFLDQLCEEIIALETGNAKRYRGNYSFYEEQRELDLVALATAYEQQQREIKRKTATIERFRAKATKSKMAKSMQKELDKVERITLPPSAKQVSFSFPPVQRAGRIVLNVKNVAHTFGENKIFSNANFAVERGQKIALIAPNGAGKSTLFNLICRKFPLQTGEITFGYSTEHALFEQDQNKSLDLNATILENVQSCCANKSESTIRSFLGSFLFSGEDVEKKVKVLSGGEKNRVSMVCVLLQDANFLLLDEPTNHLDIQSKEVLLKALLAYQGTILFVSHDRDFVNKLATDIIELEPNGTTKYHGNYESYLYQKQHAQPASPVKTQTKTQNIKKEQNKQQHELRKQSKKLENKIEKLEEEITQLELKFVDFRYGTPEFEKNQTAIEDLKNKIEELTTQWEELQK